MIRVSIVSPNHALRVGLREMLGGHSEIYVVGEATHLDGVREQETEVVVLASVSSVSFVQNEKRDYAILFLTDDVSAVRSLARSGVRVWGALSSESTRDELIAGVLAVGEGLWVGAPGLVGEWMRLPRGGEFLGEESLVEPLTAREREILQRMAQGLANKQIALLLGISEHTVKFHLSSLYAKLDVSSRTEAVRKGFELGLILL